MIEVARNVWQLAGYPPHLVNAYLAENILIDTATRWARRRILRQLQRRPLALVALTHCHPDHQGTARLVCRRFRVPLACHVLDVPALEGRAPMQPQNRLIRLAERFLSGPPCPVGRVLREGEMVGSFRVVHAPGHTPGHVIYFRESDRVAIAGDVLANIHFVTRQVGLRQPPAPFSVDAAQNRRSIRRLCALRPSLVCFGHGPPLRDLALLEQFVATMV